MGAADRKYFSGEKLSEEEFMQELQRETPGVTLLNNPSGATCLSTAVPPGVLIVEKFLPAGICEEILSDASQMQGFAGLVRSEGEAGDVSPYMAKTRRVEDFPAHVLNAEIDRLLGATLSRFMGKHYSVEFEWFESPMVLRYREQGEYMAHADAYNWVPETKTWKRVENRDYSMLIYLNDDYEGGELEFKYLNFRIQPKRGLFIAFPSDWRYAHAALPVLKGVKHAIVSFAAVKGSPRLDRPLPDNLIRIRD